MKKPENWGDDTTLHILRCRRIIMKPTPNPDIPEYADLNRMFANLRKMTNPENLDPFLDSNLVGSVDTVCCRIDALIALGLNHFMVSCATPGTPVELPRRMMSRFAEEVCPRYSRAMAQVA